MLTAQQEADYYKSLVPQCEYHSKYDPDMIKVAEKFRKQAESWQEKANKEKENT